MLQILSMPPVIEQSLFLLWERELLFADLHHRFEDCLYADLYQLAARGGEVHIAGIYKEQ